MSDSETPQDNPERDPAAGPPAAQPAAAAPQPPAQRPLLALSSPADGRARAKHAGRARRGIFAAAATLCIAAGTVGSVLAAPSVARSDSAQKSTAFRQSSASVAATL